MSKARKDRLAFWEIKASPKITTHVKELVWYELAEDHNVFLETARDRVGRYPHDGLRNAIQHDNIYTLPDLANIATQLFWLPSVPKHDDPQRAQIEASRTQIINQWIPHFYQALESMPKLDTFTSRPMPSHHVLSGPSCSYEFTAYHFQMDVRGDIQGYQRNDGLFSILLPAIIYLGNTIRHLHWADETHGTSSSVTRLRYRHKLCFKYLHSLDLCLCLPLRTSIPMPLGTPYTPQRITCWTTLGECLHRTKKLSHISLCFEMANPKIGVLALARAFQDVLFNEKVRLPGLKSLTLREGPMRRFRFLEILLDQFLVRYGPQLRHLRFERWAVTTNTMLRLGMSNQMELDSFKVDNSEFERGFTILEADLVGSVNRNGKFWRVPLEERMVALTIGEEGDAKEDACICDWANPRFADVPEGMDYCAVLADKEAPAGGDGDDEDDDYQPSESTDTSESDSEFDQDSDFDVGDDSEQN
ncbi:hypothetical protein KVR01_013547 [Diaporthe batatas]|uniref:uncharacterized protein n=1 Tax=Diaporthe batatas TaxID=748121 RepID=UPI001D0568A8|nr:uncharacterized protein KVR01_013547 [Diaporthe batatas]KAG8156596.1 hypothetical protein KVR01_013547 [Diaporthe batatas]